MEILVSKKRTIKRHEQIPYDYSCILMTCWNFIVIQTIRCRYWTGISAFVVIGSVVFYFCLAFVLFEAIPTSWLASTSSFVSYGIAFKTMATPHFWFSILLVSYFFEISLCKNMLKKETSKKKLTIITVKTIQKGSSNCGQVENRDRNRISRYYDCLVLASYRSW